MPACFVFSRAKTRRVFKCSLFSCAIHNASENKNTAMGFFGNIFHGISNAFKAVGHGISHAATGIVHFASGALNKVASAGKYVIDKASSTVTGVVTTAKSAVVGVAHEAGTAVSSVGKSLSMPLMIGVAVVGVAFVMKRG